MDQHKENTIKSLSNSLTSAEASIKRAYGYLTDLAGEVDSISQRESCAGELTSLSNAERIIANIRYRVEHEEGRYV